MSGRSLIAVLLLSILIAPFNSQANPNSFEQNTISQGEHERAKLYTIVDSPPGASIYGISDASSLSYSEHCDCFVFTTDGYGLGLPIGDIDGWFSDTSNSWLHRGQIAVAKQYFGSASQIEFFEGGNRGMFVMESESRAYSFTISELGRLSRPNQGDCTNQYVSKYCNLKSIQLMGDNNESLLGNDGVLSLYAGEESIPPRSFNNVTSHVFNDSNLFITQFGKIGIVSLKNGTTQYLNTSETCSNLYSDMSGVFVQCSQGVYLFNDSSNNIDHVFSPPGVILELAVSTISGKIAYLIQGKEDTLYLFDLETREGGSKKLSDQKRFLNVEFDTEGDFLMVLGLFDSRVLYNPEIEAIPQSSNLDSSTDFLVSICVGVAILVLIIAVITTDDSDVGVRPELTRRTEPTRPVSTKGRCKKCGGSIVSNNAVVKGAKTAVYTPLGGWIGMTLGFAAGGFPGLFLAGAGGALGGFGAATADKEICASCRFSDD